MEAAVRDILHALEQDAEREGLQKTPQRAAKAWRYLTSGHGQNLEDVVGTALFSEGFPGIVTVKDIAFYSLCEHHMLPFFGKVHVAYIPRDHVLGLSKFARIVELYARRLSMQERLTNEVAQAIEKTLQPRGLAVVVEASHMCMAMRGVRCVSSTSVTSKITGEMLSSEHKDVFLNSVFNSRVGTQTVPRSPEKKKTTLRVAKEDMKFSAAHYTIFSATEREGLHGHDHFVSLELTGEVADNGLLGGVCYSTAKSVARDLCREWDEKVLLPAQSPFMELRNEGDSVVAEFSGQVHCFPKADVLILPIPNTSLECLAELFAARYAHALELTAMFQGCVDVSVTVSGSPGQFATSRRSAGVLFTSAPAMSGTAVITGASKGIGKATAAKMLRAGWDVWNLSRTACSVEGVRNVEVDLSKESEVAAGEI